MPALSDIAAFLDEFLQTTFPGEPPTLFRPSPRPVSRLGLALEPTPDLPAWAEYCHLDAVFLHRPWRVNFDILPADLGLLASHLAFDERLTTSFNPRLADALCLTDLQPFGEKDGRMIGMTGTANAKNFDAWTKTLREIFGGLEETQAGAGEEIGKIAVVGAMTEKLVQDAHAQNVQLYVTGQFRQPARDAVTETGIAIAALGHQRSEEWGLRALAGVLRERWEDLKVVTQKPPARARGPGGR